LVIATLGPLEMQVLGLLRVGEGQGVSEVHEALSEDGHELAYTTVMTILSRLHEKGLLTRTKVGRRFVYQPNAKVSEAKASILQRIHGKLFRGTRLAPIAALIDAEDLDHAELRALRRLVDKKLRERGE
jgi:predicted transcriptional regulator